MFNSVKSMIPLLAVLLTCLSVVSLAAVRRDPFGTTGRPLPLFLSFEELVTEDMIDSGCSLRGCYGSCDQWDTGYKCWGKGIYERYGYELPGERIPLPIRVDMSITCWVVVFKRQECSASDSEVGSGWVQAKDHCWINQIFSGPYGEEGPGCACTEL